MKVILSMDNGTRITSDMTAEKAKKIFDAFCNEVRLSPLEIVAATEAQIQQFGTKVGRHMLDEATHKIYLANCESCDAAFVVKREGEIVEGDSIQCNCGNKIMVQSIGTGNGSCPNCLTGFFHMGVINEAKKYSCRNCGSPIDLFEKKTGNFVALNDL